MRTIECEFEDYAMKYEGLARAVFECFYYDDPFKIASQTVYNGFSNPVTLKNKRVISTILTGQIIKSHQQNCMDDVMFFKDLDEKVWASLTLADLNEIIDHAYNRVIELEN